MPQIIIQFPDDKSEPYPLAMDRVTIGRSRESDIFLPDQWLSRHHAEILKKGDAFFIVDLKSKNGTLLNGQSIQEEKRLRAGDVITLGEHTLTFSSADVADDEDKEPEGTRVFSVRELSDINTKPAIDPTELVRQNRVLTILKNATEELMNHRPLDELFGTILHLLFEAVPAQRGAILLLDGDPPRPAIRASLAREGATITHISRSIARRVLEEKVSLLLPSILEDERFRSEESIVASGIRSAMCAPLWFTGGSRADSVIGLVYLDSLQRSHTFGEEDLRILTALANVAAAKIENVRLIEGNRDRQRLEDEMRKAAELQKDLLPKSTPQVPGYGLAGLNQSCVEVGGDYYDFTIEDGRLLMALGDVSGKGLAAALLMAMLRPVVRALWANADLADAVARINRTLCQNVPENKYVTFFAATLEPKSGRMSYVNAGHNPPVLVRAAGRTECLEDGGTVLGLFEAAPYAHGQTTMEPGDTLIIYSDGVTETWDPNGHEFGDRGLADLARRGRGLEAGALQDEILRELERFSAGAKATDDRTLIVLKRY
jgi:phosphoserine phosphatase RsbU/P